MTGSLMHGAQRLLSALRHQHGEGIEAFMALARTLAGVVASVDPKPHAIGAGRGRIKRRKARASKKVAAPIAPVVQKEIPPAPAAKSDTPSAIVVRTDADNEAIEHAGKVMELTTRHAQFLALLAKPSPLPVDRRFLVSKLWPDQVPKWADSMLGALATDCGAAAAAVGLKIKTVRGVGYALQPVEAQ